VSRDSYSEINLHIVWHTKLSMPLLTPPIEAFVHRYLKHRLLAEERVIVHAIGGIENHVHVAISVPPTVLISELIGRMKGGAAHEANLKFGVTDKILEWQRGYGVVSFGTRNLPWVKAYVENQQQHHARGTLQDRLENAGEPEDKEPS
jgi:putative transposase